MDHLHDAAETEGGRDGESPKYSTPARGEMVIIVQSEDAENIVILVNRLAKVPPLLLVPPVAIRVAVSSLLNYGVDVAAILDVSASLRHHCHARCR